MWKTVALEKRGTDTVLLTLNWNVMVFNKLSNLIH